MLLPVSTLPLEVTRADTAPAGAALAADVAAFAAELTVEPAAAGAVDVGVEDLPLEQAASSSMAAADPASANRDCISCLASVGGGAVGGGALCPLHACWRRPVQC